MHYLDQLDSDRSNTPQILHRNSYNNLILLSRHASSVISKYACKQLKHAKESSLKPISRDYFASKIQDDLFIDHLSIDKTLLRIFAEVESKHNNQEYDDPMHFGFKCDLWLEFKHLITKCRFVSMFGIIADNASHGPIFIFTKVLYHLIRLGYACQGDQANQDECLSQSLKLIALQSMLTEDDFPTIGVLDAWRNEPELFARLEHTYTRVRKVVILICRNSSNEGIDKHMLDIILSCVRDGVVACIVKDREKEEEEKISTMIRDVMFDYIKLHSPLPRLLCAYFIIILSVCDFFDLEQSLANLEHFHGRVKVEYLSSKITDDHMSVSSIMRRSMPIPQPPVGGMPYSSARTKSWS